VQTGKRFFFADAGQSTLTSEIISRPVTLRKVFARHVLIDRNMVETEANQE
jgi:hypothetical protein